ncbi:unnamed protein product [Eruca vesicaria subsp. sativa]|uniref:Glycoside hydrolase family 31 TIM barrel domain-containing protein n=1 Tax=Eruca vesicaria subsp. sativa TaxID=29727 RepID=A0ABC8IX83_ERUVS|nr:unnamed protein product [Eruca vesicaria subsp. sativa]
MPYWSFGFHQRRYGCNNVSDLESVVDGYAKAEIPLEVTWKDIDYMDGFKDFTLDHVNFPEDKMKSFVNTLSQEWSEIRADLGSKVSCKLIQEIENLGLLGVNSSSYGTYNRGMVAYVFIKREGEPYLSEVWNGKVYYPHFLNPTAATFLA